MKALNTETQKIVNIYEETSKLIELEIDWKRFELLTLTEGECYITSLVEEKLKNNKNTEVLFDVLWSGEDIDMTGDYLWTSKLILKTIIDYTKNKNKNWGIIPSKIDEFLFASLDIALDVFNHELLYNITTFNIVFRNTEGEALLFISK